MKLMNAKDILDYYKKIGIELWSEAGKLKYKAPQMSLSEEHIKVLKENKEELLDYLENKKEDIAITIDRNSRYEAFPMSDVQTAYLLGRKNTFEYSGVACHVYFEVNYDKLNIEKVRKTWDLLVSRHDMLRAVMNENGYQQILEAVPELDIPYIDITEDSLKENGEIQSLRKEMSHRIYELGKWPMFGIAVSKHNSGDTLHFSMEFLIADWTSIWLLLSEFEALYFSLDKVLPDFELSFRDYILAERRLKTSDAYETDKAYWIKQIEQFPAAPELPLKISMDINDKPAFKRILMKMDIDKWLSFKSNAQKCGITPTVAVLAVYAEVIERWSNNKEFVINLTVLNRMPLHEDINKLVGDFTTVSLLAVDAGKSNEFTEFAKSINSKLFEDLDHRLYSGIEVIRELARKRNQPSLMPIVFTSAIGLIDSNNQLLGKVEGFGISQTPQVFIDCQAMDGNFGLQINWDIREGIFPEGMIEDMFQAFEEKIHRLSAGLEEWGSSKGIDIPQWQVREREEANATKTALPKGFLYSKFLEQVKVKPNDIAVDDGEGSFTYKELDSFAKAIAFEVVKHGGNKQDKIAVVMDKSRYQVAAVLGILYMGGVYVPVDAKQTGLRRTKILDNLGSNIVLTLSCNNNIYTENICTLEVDRIIRSNDFEVAENQIENPAYIIYTSGSTGLPKGVVISHEAAVNTIEDINKKFQVKSSDKILALSQLNFDLSVYDIFGMLSVGGTIIYPKNEHYLNPSYWADLIEKHNITIWNSVPALMKMLLTQLQTETSKREMPLRLVLLSGDWIPLNMPEQLAQQISEIEVICLGGATEASIWSIYHSFNEIKPHWSSIPYGKPLANQSFRILDKNYKDCPVWVAGEIYIAGAGLAEGYYQDTELTETKFFKHPFDGQRIYKTGDMGRYLPGGEIEFLGRADNQIKLNGHRIELGEIESAINKHPSVSAAVAFIDEGKNELCAVVEPAEIEGYSEAMADLKFNELTSNIGAEVVYIADKLESVNLEEITELRNKASLISLLYAFQKLGLLDTDKYYDIEDFKKHKDIQEKYHWLIMPWLSSLTSAGLISQNERGLYRAELQVTEEQQRELWERLHSSWSEELGSIEIIDYIRINAQKLAEILRGNVDPLSLLYTEVDTSYTRALYIDNTMATYLNKCIGQFVKKIAEENPDRKLRILEIGAGSGATTQHVISSLEGYAFEYYFTDVTKYFFANAKKEFGEKEEVIIKSFDIDKDYMEQGFAPNSFDIVIGAYVLENAKDIEESLKRIEALLMPQGYLLFSAPFRDEEWLLVSQALMMTLPEDNLREKVAFMEQETWLNILKQHGDNEAVKVIPEKNSRLSCMGLNLFIKQFKREREKINTEDIKQHISLYLPDYMKPKSVYFLDNIPLTSNGKIDRNKAQKAINIASNQDVDMDNTDLIDNELERVLSNVWCEALKLEKIGKNQNFYDFGADSLIMAQVATKIRNNMNLEIPFEAILRQMLNQPTIYDLAKYISQEKNKTITENSADVKFDDTNNREGSFAYLQRYGGAADKRTRVMLHGVLGSVDCYRFLAPELVSQEQGEVFGIGISDLDKYCSLLPSETVDFLADHYTKLLLERKVNKLQLIGYSFSGVIAVEMAKRLTENGVEVEDVVIIDGGSMPVDIQEELMYELLFIDNIHVTLSDLGFSNNELLEKAFEKIMKDDKKTISIHDFEVVLNDTSADSSSNILNDLKNSTQKERFEIYEKLTEKNTGNIIPAPVIAKLYQIFKQSFCALQVIPDAYFGDIRYFSSKEKEGIFKYFKVLLKDWENVCLGDFTLEEIEGNHYTCIEERENAIELAKLIGSIYEVQD